MDPILTIASTTPASLLAYAGQLFTDTQLLVYLAIGIPLGFYIIKKVIGLISSRTK
jgi:hypothetical protein